MKKILRLIILPAFIACFLLYGGAVIYVLESESGNARLPAECALVFGAAVWPVYDEQGNQVTSAAGPGIRRRVSTAVALFHRGLVDRLILTGGRGEGSRLSEAEVMLQVALDRGVPRDRVHIEDQSTSTIENLENTRNLTSACTKVVAISDAYHLGRIQLLGVLMDIPLETYPAEGGVSRLFSARNVLREAAGIILLPVSVLSR